MYFVCTWELHEPNSTTGHVLRFQASITRKTSQVYLYRQPMFPLLSDSSSVRIARQYCAWSSVRCLGPGGTIEFFCSASSKGSKQCMSRETDPNPTFTFRHLIESHPTKPTSRLHSNSNSSHHSRSHSRMRPGRASSCH
jgi:hypothetical protein